MRRRDDPERPRERFRSSRVLYAVYRGTHRVAVLDVYSHPETLASMQRRMSGPVEAIRFLGTPPLDLPEDGDGILWVARSSLSCIGKTIPKLPRLKIRPPVKRLKLVREEE